jgi:very-short-patch-repair endonuclease
VKPRKPLPSPLDRVPFTTVQGRRAGLGRQRLRGKDLAHPFRGVYAAIEGDLGIDDLCRILQVRLPGDAYFCDSTAALIMRIPLPRKLEQLVPVHVAVPSPKTAPTGKGIRGHSVHTDLSDMRSWGGLHVASPEQTWCRLAAKLALPELVAAGDYIVHWRMPLATTAQLTSAVDRHGSRAGIATLREALPLLDDRSESPKESEVRVIFVRAGLPGLEVNFPIRTRDGYRYRADLAFPSRKTIVEYQSRFHDPALNFRQDMTRISRLEADGWVVIQVNNDDLADPDELVRRVIRVLEARPVFE